MELVRYMISDAAKKIDVEPHVLRYWEEELAVEIPRNEMGHRYYREEEIGMMQGVKYLKEKGFQLKSIKILLPDIKKVMTLEQRRLLELRDRLELAVSQEELRLQREEELRQCEEASAEKKLECSEKEEEKPQDKMLPLEPEKKEVPQNYSDGEAVSQDSEKMQQFRKIMNEIILGAMSENNRQLTDSITESVSRELEYHMKKKELLEEEHFKQLDRTLREYQQGQKQAAVTKEYPGARRQSKFFKKNKVRI